MMSSQMCLLCLSLTSTQNGQQKLSGKSTSFPTVWFVFFWLTVHWGSQVVVGVLLLFHTTVPNLPSPNNLWSTSDHSISSIILCVLYHAIVFSYLPRNFSFLREGDFSALSVKNYKMYNFLAYNSPIDLLPAHINGIRSVITMYRPSSFCPWPLHILLCSFLLHALPTTLTSLLSPQTGTICSCHLPFWPLHKLCM